VEAEAGSAPPPPPQYNAPRSDMSVVEQQAHVEEPAYVYKSDGVGAKEARDPFADEKRAEAWPADKKL
jgi:hypothetical protein